MHEVVDRIDLWWVLRFDACGCITPFEAIALASRSPFLRRRDFDALSPASKGEKKGSRHWLLAWNCSRRFPKCGQYFLSFGKRQRRCDACLLRQYGLCLPSGGVFRLCKVAIGLDREGARDGIPQKRCIYSVRSGRYFVSHLQAEHVPRPYTDALLGYSVEQKHEMKYYSVRATAACKVLALLFNALYPLPQIFNGHGQLGGRRSKKRGGRGADGWW